MKKWLFLKNIILGYFEVNWSNFESKFFLSNSIVIFKIKMKLTTFVVNAKTIPDLTPLQTDEMLNKKREIAVTSNSS